MIIGIHGVQGCGKSTLVKKLVQKNLSYEQISIDDFYLPYNELQNLDFEPLWRVRGNPGTHDFDLLIQVLYNFKQGVSSSVPIYDKTQQNGKGDRIGFRTLVPGNVLFIEGWCLGFQHQNLKKDDILYRIDQCVEKYEAIHQSLDAFLILKPPNFPILDIVQHWREEAEDKERKKGKCCMNKTEVSDFVQVYMPAYKMYLPTLYSNPPIHPTVVVELDTDRMATAAFFCDRR
tara:strand:+ start:345 stop:1040 length:696 start_codon:yes stop_codon:yes gene_type:complete